MTVLPTVLARCAMCVILTASALAHGPARAGVIYLSQYGVLTDNVVTFNLAQKTAAGALAAGLFAEQGVAFSGAAYLNPCAPAYYGYGGIRGNHLSTLGANCRTSAADDTFTLTLARPVERFTMSLAASDAARRDHFTLFQQGAQVASFSLSQLDYYLGGDCADPLGCVRATQARPQGFLVIDGIVFDQLRFADAGADNSWLVFDNLGFDTARAVAEPPLPALGGAALLALALATVMRRRRAAA